MCGSFARGCWATGRAYSALVGTDSAAGEIDGSPANRGVDVGNWISQDGGVAVVVDKVMSDNVARVVFETYRNQVSEELGLNEVRLHLYMAAYSETREVRSLRRFTSTFQLRTQADSFANITNFDAFIGDVDPVTGES